MEENTFTTSRNNHEQKDLYDPETNTLDIRSNGQYPSNVLSNLCSNGFRFDGMVCGSMEGFLQSLKQQELDKQRQICSMKGGNARKRSVTSWQTDQIVWWKGQPVNRQSKEFQQLLRMAYRAMFEQSERFRTALMSTRGITLSHAIGEDCSYKTILTPNELCSILTEMRDEYDRRIMEQANEPVVRRIVNSDESGTPNQVFAIHPSFLIDKKLVMRANNSVECVSVIQANFTNELEGLDVLAVYEIENGQFEVKMAPIPEEKNPSDYFIPINFALGNHVSFYVEDQFGNRQVIGEYN